MKTLILGIIIVYEANSGQAISQGLAVFDTLEQCQAAVEAAREEAPFTLAIEGECVEVPYRGE